MRNKFFRLGHLTFVNDIGLRLPTGSFRLFAQNFLRKWVRHIDDGGINILLVRAQREEIGRNAHDDIHKRQINQGRQIAGDGLGGLQIASREMSDQFLQRHFHFARGELAQDQTHGQTNFGGGST